MTVYLIHADGTDRYKVGSSKKGGDKRMRALTIGAPYPLRLLAEVIGSMETEAVMRMSLHEHQVYNEWFCFEDDRSALLAFFKAHSEAESFPLTRDPGYSSPVLVELDSAMSKDGLSLDFEINKMRRKGESWSRIREALMESTGVHIGWELLNRVYSPGRSNRTIEQDTAA